MVQKAGLFPLDIGANVQAKLTRVEKVSYFLTQIGPGADSNLPKLLEVMKQSGVTDVVQLAEKIVVATGGSNALTQTSSSA